MIVFWLRPVIRETERMLAPSPRAVTTCARVSRDSLYHGTRCMLRRLSYQGVEQDGVLCCEWSANG